MARPLLSGAQEDLAQLLQEVHQIIPVPIEGILSDGQLSIRAAVATVFPQIPHQLCQFHFLREAAKPIAEADRHAKKELKKQVRGVRPLEHQLEQSKEKDAEILRQYCVAVRAALTDEGRPPLAAAGLRLQTRLTQIRDSLQRVAEKGAVQALGTITSAPQQGITSHSSLVGASPITLSLDLYMS